MVTAPLKVLVDRIVVEPDQPGDRISQGIIAGSIHRRNTVIRDNVTRDTDIQDGQALDFRLLAAFETNAVNR